MNIKHAAMLGISAVIAVRASGYLAKQVVPEGSPQWLNVGAEMVAAGIVLSLVSKYIK